MNKFWDEKYKQEVYIYGQEPNEFLKAQLNKLKTGSILLPAEGEGRNAVYAAGLGWDVTAFDSSIEGQKKALALASKKNVNITYLLHGYEEMNFEPNQFDIIALTYAHMPSQMRKAIHAKLIGYLKPGGKIILEAFDKEQLNFSSGGPKDLDLLVNTSEIANEFTGLKTLELKQETIILNEGPLHQGEAKVVRFVGQK